MNFDINKYAYCNVPECFAPSPWRKEGKNDSFKCPIHGFIYGTDPETKKDLGANALYKKIDSIDFKKYFKKHSFFVPPKNT